MTTPDTAELAAGRELDALIAQRVMGLHVILPDGQPHFSTSIEAAWHVVEHLRQRFDFVLSWEQRIDVWLAEFWPIDAKDDSPLGGANAPTAPLAICRAALATIGAADR